MRHPHADAAAPPGRPAPATTHSAADFAAWVDGVVADLVRAGAAVHTETEIFGA